MKEWSVSSTSEPLLQVRHLNVTFETPDGPVAAVQGLSFNLEAGKTLALVGESGSGKSVTAYALMRLLPPATRIEGETNYGNENLLELSEARMRALRGKDIAMVFQEPMTALNPLTRIGLQIRESLYRHTHLRGAAARARVLELLQQVGIP